MAYRKKVLGAVHPDPTIFQKSVNKVLLTSTQLLENLLRLIKGAEQETEVLQQAGNTVTVQPKVFTREQLLKEKEKLDEKMTINEEKANKKRKKKDSGNLQSKRHRTC